MSEPDARLALWLRERCSAKFDLPFSTDMFYAHELPGETNDQTMLRVFREQRAQYPAGVTDEEIVNIMVYG